MKEKFNESVSAALYADLLKGTGKEDDDEARGMLLSGDRILRNPHYDLLERSFQIIDLSLQGITGKKMIIAALFRGLLAKDPEHAHDWLPHALELFKKPRPESLFPTGESVVLLGVALGLHQNLEWLLRARMVNAKFLDQAPEILTAIAHSKVSAFKSDIERNSPYTLALTESIQSFVGQRVLIALQQGGRIDTVLQPIFKALKTGPRFPTNLAELIYNRWSYALMNNLSGVGRLTAAERLLALNDKTLFVKPTPSP